MQQDFAALQWVLTEIDRTADELVRTLLGYADNLSDETRLRQALTAAHQLHASLRVVGVASALRLGGEIEATVEAILHGRITASESCLQILLAATLQMPAYLRRVATERRESSFDVLVLANELRVARGEEPIPLPSPAELIDVSELGQGCGDAAAPASDDDQQLLRRARGHFQVELLGLLKDEDVPARLARLQKVFTLLGQRLRRSGHALFWQVAGAYAEALARGGVSFDDAARAVLRELDAAFRAALARESGLYAQAPDAGVYRRMLLAIGTSRPVSVQIADIQQRHRLMPDARDGTRARAVLDDLGAIGTVVDFLGGELSQTLERLESSDGDAFSIARVLREVEPDLRRVAAILAGLGYRAEHERLHPQLELIRAGIPGGAAADEMLTEMSAALLDVDQRLAARAVAAGGDSSARAESRQHPLVRAIAALCREVMSGVEQIKQTVNDYALAGNDASLFDDVSARLHAMGGALRMAELDMAAQVLQQCRVYVDALRSGKRARPGAQDVEHFADALSSVEYFLERLIIDQQPADILLARARTALQALNAGDGAVAVEPASAPDLETMAVVESVPSAPVEDVAEPVAEEIVEEILVAAPPVVAVAEPEPSTVDLVEASLPAFAADSAHDLEPGAELESELAVEAGESPLIAPEPVETPVPVIELETELSVESLPEIVPERAEESAIEFEPVATVEMVEAVEPAAPSSEAPVAVVEEEPLPPVAAEEIPAPVVAAETAAEAEEEAEPLDPEIVEIFVEEAAEVLQTIEEQFPLWRASPGGGAPLTELRRAYHTLKGSGRMVGATVIGELAWSIEHLLNRVLERAVTATADVVEAVDRSRGLMPDLVQAFATRGAADRAAVEALRAAADALARGESVTWPEAAAIEAPVVEEIPIAEALAAAEELLPAFAPEPVETPVPVIELETELSAESLPEIVPEPAEVSTIELEPVATLEMVEAVEPAAPSSEAPVAVVEEEPLPPVVPEEIPVPVVAAETAAEAEEEAEPLDPEIVEIFVEEAAEVLQTIEEQFPLWRASPGGGAPLTELRRAYHTLKGSGRMVGATVIGELAWSIEHLLNRVLERAVTATADVVEAVDRSRGLMPDLVQAFATRGAADRAAVEALRAAADALARGESVTWPEAAAIEAPVVEEIPIAEALAAAEELLPAFAPEPVETPVPVIELETELSVESLPDLAAEPEPEVAATPEALPAETGMVFDATLPDTLEPVPEATDALRAEDGLVVSELDFSVLPTEPAPLEPVAEMPLVPIEEIAAGAAAEAEAAAPEAALPDFGELDLSALAEEALAEEEQPQDLVEDWLPELEPEEIAAAGEFEPSADARLLEIFAEEAAEHLRVLREFLSAGSAATVVEPVQRAMHTLKGSTRTAGLDPIAAVAAPLEDIVAGAARHAQSLDATAVALLGEFCTLLDAVLGNGVRVDADLGARAHDLAQRCDSAWQAQRDAAEVVQAPAAEPRFARFLEQALEKLFHATTLLQSWQDGRDSADSSQVLAAELQTIHQRAEQLDVRPVLTLSGPLQDVVAAYARDVAGAPAELFVVAKDALEALLDVLDQLAAGQPAEPSVGIVERLDALAAAHGHTAPELLPPADAPIAPESDREVVRGRIVRDIAQADPELLAIFLEEAQDLLVEIDESIDAWRHDRDNRVPFDELQRHLHTLKGGARMAGLKYLGDISHNFETFLINQNLHFGSFDDSFFVRVADFQEQLLVAVDLVRERPTTPEDVPAEAAPEPATIVDHVDAQAGAMEPPAELPVALEAPPAPAVVAPPVPVVDAEFRQRIAAELAEADPDLLGIFLEEAEDLLVAIDGAIDTWRRRRDDATPGHELQRHLHTLKGGARMTGLKSIGNQSHEFETFLIDAMHAGVADDAFFARIGALQELLSQVMDVVRGVPYAPAEPSTADMPAAPEPVLEPQQPDAAEPEPVAAQAEPEPVAPEPEPVAAEPEPVVEAPDVSVLPPAPEPVELPADMRERIVAERGGADAELLGIFIEEADELMVAIDAAIDTWRTDRGSRAPGDDLQRHLHTLKGGARMAGLMTLGGISHDLETFVVDATQAGRIDDAFFTRIAGWHEQLAQAMDVVREQAPVAAAVIDAVAPPAPAETPVVAAPAPVVAPAQPVAPPPVIAVPPAPAPFAPAVAAPGAAQMAAATAAAKPKEREEVVRVSAQLLEELVNLAGETSISRGRVEEQVNELAHLFDDMQSAIERVQGQVRRLDIATEAQVLFRRERVESTAADGFDPLEMDRYSQLQQLSRSLVETASDLMDIKRTLAEKTRDLETVLIQQSRINTQLQEGLMRSRMVPFSSILPRLKRIVRQVSAELDKKVELEMGNVTGDLDRGILERVVAPLEHMLRNAVDHGIESLAKRRAAGKPDVGRILIDVARDGGDVLISLQDDGAGVNIDAVRRKAIERGLMQADAALGNHEIVQFILHAGFSTAEKVTQISGRGVGMDVVTSELRQMGGSLEIHTEPGQGSRFLIRLPFTVSVSRALLVRVGAEIVALPLNTVEGVVRLRTDELHQYTGPDARLFEYAGHRYAVRYLGTLLYPGEQMDMSKVTDTVPIVLIRGGGQMLAVQVDRLMGASEIVVKSIGPQFGAVPGLSGATVLGDGSVVVILDVPSMLRADAATVAVPRAAVETAAVEKAQRPPLIMVVDDSVTVRKVTSRFLEREGMTVLTAKDGSDAMAKLQEQIPDLMLLDIEMPHMDGFEVLSKVRLSEQLRHLPIIMITSRTGEKHRERALSLGASMYLGKPYQETVLLEHIHSLLQRGKDTDA